MRTPNMQHDNRADARADCESIAVSAGRDGEVLSLSAIAAIV